MKNVIQQLWENKCLAVDICFKPLESKEYSVSMKKYQKRWVLIIFLVLLPYFHMCYSFPYFQLGGA